MKERKSTKMYVSYESDFLKQIKANADDSYFLEVLYYYIRRALIVYDYNLREVDGFILNGRFLGTKQEVLISDIFNSPIKSISLAMSIKAFMIDRKYIQRCYDDRLLFYDLDRTLLSWDAHKAIMECYVDEDFRLLYEMVLSYKTEYRFTDEQKELFKNHTIRPEYRNFDKYCRSIASDPEYDGNSVIKNSEYLYADFSKFEVPEQVDYIGDAAFAYCNNLESISFKKKVLFGHFPIIECNKLRQIIVPTDLVDYYKLALPYYKDVISDAELNNPVFVDDESVEHVYVDVPSADSYTEIEVDEIAPEVQIDTHKLETVFDNISTSYKYFWFLSIITLAREKQVLSLSFKDVLIRMAAMAWPLVFVERVNLGQRDMLTRYLNEIKDNNPLAPTLSSDIVENYLRRCYSSNGIDRILAPLLKNVPYRFLSPWVRYTTDEEVVKTSQAVDFDGVYKLFDKSIVIKQEWWDYINSNFLTLCNFTLRSFITYLEKNNDSVELQNLLRIGMSFVRQK